jgi:hypothetical protein
MGGPFQPRIRAPGTGRGFRLMELTGSWFTRASQNARVFALLREWSQPAADAGTVNGSSLGRWIGKSDARGRT